MTCITGLTAQNTQGVKQIYPVESQEMIGNTLDAVFLDVGVDAVKTGMLSIKETVGTVVSRLKSYKPKYIVVDPVMVSTSGSELISKEATETYINELFPLATLITPNLVEAQHLLGNSTKQVKSVNDMKELAKSLKTQLKCSAVLVKGGHAGMNDKNETDLENPTKIVDVLYDDKEQFTLFENPFVNSKNTHGTGCSLASAITSNLANGKQMSHAVKDAIHYVQQGITSAHEIGHGNGPINHMHNIDVRPFSKGKFLDYLLRHPKVEPHWQRYVNHPFTKQIAKNTVEEKRFKFFLKQDYTYLLHYSRAHSLAGYKAHDFDTINASASIVKHIREELELHIAYCKQFGITVDELNQNSESQACFAYSRYLLDVGHQEDWLALQVALSPCLFGYLMAAEALYNDPESVRENNPYWKWVENYVADDYRQASVTGRELLESHIVHISPARLEQLVDIFATVTKMECGFWDQCL